MNVTLSVSHRKKWYLTRTKSQSLLPGRPPSPLSQIVIADWQASKHTCEGGRRAHRCQSKEGGMLRRCCFSQRRRRRR